MGFEGERGGARSVAANFLPSDNLHYEVVLEAQTIAVCKLRAKKKSHEEGQ